MKKYCVEGSHLKLGSNLLITAKNHMLQEQQVLEESRRGKIIFGDNSSYRRGEALLIEAWQPPRVRNKINKKELGDTSNFCSMGMGAKCQVSRVQFIKDQKVPAVRRCSNILAAFVFDPIRQC